MTDDSYDEFLAWLRRTLAPGAILYLRPQLNISGGWYTVVSLSGSMIDLRPRKGDAVRISIDQCIKAIDLPLDVQSAPEQGVLRLLGYSVGKNGRPAVQRRRALETVYKLPLSSLPKVANWSEWGEAQSPERLGKIRRCLTSFADQASQRRDAPVEAIQDWQSDLAWLGKRFPPP